MSNPTKKYLVGGVLVEAVKSEGGGFYELTVLATGEKQRYIAEVFESVAKPYKGRCSACGKESCELQNNLLHKSYG